MILLQFQNRRAKWRKKENTKKAPGRPAHNAHPQTCSGEPRASDIRKKEANTSEFHKDEKQENPKAISTAATPTIPKSDASHNVARESATENLGLTDSDKESASLTSWIFQSDTSATDGRPPNKRPRSADNGGQKSFAQQLSSQQGRHGVISKQSGIIANKSNAFTIDHLLAASKVPRGRRPNAKYPRVQACKSMSPFGLGMFPLYPVTQPAGFTIKADDHDVQEVDIRRELQKADSQDDDERSSKSGTI